MGGRISAQNWYQDKRSRRSGEANHTRGASVSGLRTGKNRGEKLDIRVSCRVLWPAGTDDCEVSVCADDKPTKSYHVWQRILYAPLPKDLAYEGNPLVAPKRIIIPSKKNSEGILLGDDMCISLYVNGAEIPGGCLLDKRLDQGLDVIAARLSAELPKAELSQRRMSPQNKAKLLKYFSRVFVESIKKEYAYGMIKVNLPERINNNH